MSSRATNRFQDVKIEKNTPLSTRMLSPKMQRMQRSIRINDGQLLGLAEKARLCSDKKIAQNNKKIDIPCVNWQNLLKYHISAV